MPACGLRELVRIAVTADRHDIRRFEKLTAMPALQIVPRVRSQRRLRAERWYAIRVARKGGPRSETHRVSVHVVVKRGEIGEGDRPFRLERFPVERRMLR